MGSRPQRSSHQTGPTPYWLVWPVAGWACACPEVESAGYASTLVPAPGPERACRKQCTEDHRGAHPAHAQRRPPKSDGEGKNDAPTGQWRTSLGTGQHADKMGDNVR
ncbi:hypothetical protein GDO81_001070 [Engystomops pustulosus]|uniref:Secreted protein n=1 Tax=Engystomops pustulosus TaxID=76066 RepID=A0AAV7DA69_ENGPU|nr:hypothetical protein GDO81_001070 [Engystomops pustulosus]